MFRFHTGSIKSWRVLLEYPPAQLMFRFHTGSIKSTDPITGVNFAGAFRFHTGSIKRYAVLIPMPRGLYVSIPYWFD